MTDNRIIRVHYFERQFLRAQDFNDEQAYHVAMRRRHNVAQHTWGIVRGLELEFNAEDGVFIVRPGVAVDGYGRDLILSEPHVIDSTEFDARDSDQIDVWLEYRRESTDQSSANRQCAVDEASATAFNRWIETPEVVLRTDSLNDRDRRKPRTVLAGDENFDATQTPPDSSERYFPVYIGQMNRTATGKEPGYSVMLIGRPYAGLVGSEIRHPAGKVQVQVGGEDEAHFAINIHADEEKPKSTLTITPGQPDEITANGNVKVVGDVNISGALQFSESSAPSQPQPGTVYLGKADPDDPKNNTRELRVELDDPKSDKPGRFAVGVWSEQEGKFKPILQVEEGKVRITGMLVANVVTPLPEVTKTDAVLQILAARQLSGRLPDAGLGTVFANFLKLWSGSVDDGKK